MATLASCFAYIVHRSEKNNSVPSNSVPRGPGTYPFPAALHSVAGGTHRHEVEPEDVVDPQRLQLQDDRGQIAPLHLGDSGWGQLVKGFL